MLCVGQGCYSITSYCFGFCGHSQFQRKTHRKHEALHRAFSRVVWWPPRPFVLSRWVQGERESSSSLHAKVLPGLEFSYVAIWRWNKNQNARLDSAVLIDTTDRHQGDVLRITLKLERKKSGRDPLLTDSTTYRVGFALCCSLDPEL